MSLKQPSSIEDFYRRAMGAWRGRVSEECLSADLRALAKVVAKEAEALSVYTCNVVCDHGEDCRQTRQAALRTEIDALGAGP